MRAVYFNALEVNLPEEIPFEWFEKDTPLKVSPVRCLAMGTSCRIPILPPVDWECPCEEELAEVRGVIASATQHQDAATVVERVMALYHDQLHEPKLARDVDPAVRGPHGTAVIELIDGARPSARKPFRMPGER